MGFWIRNGIIGALFAITAYVLLVNQGWLEILVGESSNSTIEKTETTPNKVVSPPSEKLMVETSKPKETEQQPSTTIEKKTKNAAADGLSNFYASINPDFNDSGPMIRNNVVYLPSPKGNITDILTEKDRVTKPTRKTWVGEIESRAFRNGETLFQKLSEYSKKEGIDVLWLLDRDFIIKDPFRINKNLVSTAQIIGLSVDGHFIDGVKTYFCYSNRTFILTDSENSYLESNCNKLTHN